jgi:hypothetical protein
LHKLPKFDPSLSDLTEESSTPRLASIAFLVDNGTSDDNEDEGTESDEDEKKNVKRIIQVYLL